MLTKKQYELLMFINRRLAQDGVSPSFEEMKDALGLKSKSGIHRLISGLEERGFIRRLAHRARALEVMKRPEEMAIGGAAAEASEEPLAGRSSFSPKVIRGDFKSALPGAPAAAEAEAVELPLYGRIAAGTPIAPLRDQETTVGVPPSLLASGDHYPPQVPPPP